MRIDQNVTVPIGFPVKFYSGVIVDYRFIDNTAFCEYQVKFQIDGKDFTFWFDEDDVMRVMPLSTNAHKES